MTPFGSRRRAKRFALATAVLLALSACGGAEESSPAPAPAPEAAPAPAPEPEPAEESQEAVPVSVGLLFINADAGMFIAQDRGYFAEEGIEVTFERFTSGAEMVSLLATNNLDVGSGSPTAGLYNSIRQDLDLRIVGSKSVVIPPNFGGAAIVVRQDLVDSGAVEEIADLEGLTVAINQAGSTSSNYVIRALESAGLTKDDVNFVEMPLPQMIPGFVNKAIDAAWVFDPLRGVMQQQGHAQELAGTNTADTGPEDPTNLMYYSADFAADTEVATRFMVAHLRGLRDYYDAIIAGTAEKEPIYAILSGYTGIDVNAYPFMALSGVDPDGDIRAPALWRLQDEWMRWGFMDQRSDLTDAFDSSFLDAALQELGTHGS